MLTANVDGSRYFGDAVKDAMEVGEADLSLQGLQRTDGGDVLEQEGTVVLRCLVRLRGCRKALVTEEQSVNSARHDLSLGQGALGLAKEVHLSVLLWRVAIFSVSASVESKVLKHLARVVGEAAWSDPEVWRRQRTPRCDALPYEVLSSGGSGWGNNEMAIGHAAAGSAKCLVACIEKRDESSAPQAKESRYTHP